MLKVRRSVLAAAAALGFAASIERVDAALNCNPSGVIPCEVIHSLFGKDARQGTRPQTDLRQSASPAIGPSAGGTVRRRLPPRPARPVVRANGQMAVASGVTAPAPVALPESIRPADRVAAVFQPPNARTGTNDSQSLSKLLGWVLSAAGLASLLLAKTADI